MIHLGSLLQMTLASEPGHYLKKRLNNSFLATMSVFPAGCHLKEYWPFILALVCHQGDIAL